jgi:hypothetical protein
VVGGLRAGLGQADDLDRRAEARALAEHVARPARALGRRGPGSAPSAYLLGGPAYHPSSYQKKTLGRVKPLPHETAWLFERHRFNLECPGQAL